MKLIALLSLSVLLSAAPTTHAATFWVDGANPACSNAGPGSEAVPYCTIAAAIAVNRGPGVTLRVKPATYPEVVAVPKPGAAGNPFVLQADGPGVIVNGITVSGRSWVVVDGFTVMGPGALFQDGIHIGGSTNVTITHNRVIGFTSWGIYATAVSNLLLASNTVSGCSGHGINLRSVTNSVIQDNASFENLNGISFIVDNGPNTNNLIQRNRLYRNTGSGLHFQVGSVNNLCVQNLLWGNEHGITHSYSTGTRHIGEVVWGNTDDGISLKNGSTGIALHNCIVSDNGLGHSAYDLFVDSTSASGLVSEDNVFWTTSGQAPIKVANEVYSALYEWVAASGLDTRSHYGDPRFQDASSGDFHLLASSPAIDCGNTSIPDWPALDADGLSRADDPGMPNLGMGPVSFADRGAFEYEPTTLAVGDADDPGLALAAIAPNPTRAGARFAFSLPAAADVRLTIVDLQGRTVAVVADARYAAGRHTVAWDGHAGGRLPAPGLYFLRLRTADATISRRLAIAR